MSDSSINLNTEFNSSNIVQSWHSVCLVFGVLSNEDTKIVISKTDKSIGKMKGKRGLPLKTLVGQEYDHWYEYKFQEKRWEQINYFPYANLEHDEENENKIDEPENIYESEENYEITNANILDNNSAQQLSSNEIIKMREEKNSSDLIQTIIENSKTFDKKTKFSKEKYLKKKKQKYDLFAYVTKPTMDIIARSYFGKKANKISYLRWDSLAQLLHSAAIKPGSNVLLLSTCHGLLPAALYDRYGDSIKIFRLFPDGRGIQANFNCIKLLHNFVTHKYNPEEDPEIIDTETKYAFPQCINKDSLLHFPMGYFDTSLKHKLYNHDYYPPLIREFESSIIDCMIIATDEYDIEKWFRIMFNRLSKGGNFVVFSRFQRPLENLFRKMRERAVCVELFETWWRDYQVLKNRTHPRMVMNNCSGYLFHGIKVDEWDDPMSDV